MGDDTKGKSGHKDEGRREWLVGAPLAANHDRVCGRGGLAVRSDLHTQSAALEGMGAVASGWSRTWLYLLPCPSPSPRSRPRYGTLLLSRSCSHSQDPCSRVPAVQGVRPEGRVARAKAYPTLPGLWVSAPWRGVWAAPERAVGSVLRASHGLPPGGSSGCAVLVSAKGPRLK